MRRFFFIATLCVLQLLLGRTAFAAPGDTLFPARPVPPRLVNDLAGVLNAPDVAALEQKLVQLDRGTSTQVTVVTLRSIGDYDIAAYGVKLFESWGIGRAKKDNGVLILVSIAERRANITVGRGLEGALTDIEAGQIIRHVIVPAFRKGDYYAGLNGASDAVIEAVKGEYKAEAQAQGGRKGGMFTIIIIVLIVVFILSRMGGGGGGGGSYMSGRGRRGGFGDGFLGGMILGNLLGGRGGGWGGGGGGGFGGGGGGFGGFGGGSTGGGGASGSW